MGAGHNLSLTATKTRVSILVDEYYKEVYVKCHRKKKEKHKKNCTCNKCSTTSLLERTVLGNWKQKNNQLFDIGVNMDSLTGPEKVFYEDQKTTREGRLSQEIDMEYEEERAALRTIAQEQAERDAQEEDFMDIEDENIMNSSSIGMDTSINLNSNVNRSGLVRAAAPITEASVQTENPQPGRPLFRDLKNNRHCTEAIKATCAIISSTCGVSNEMSKK